MLLLLTGIRQSPAQQGGSEICDSGFTETSDKQLLNKYKSNWDTETNRVTATGFKSNPSYKPPSTC